MKSDQAQSAEEHTNSFPRNPPLSISGSASENLAEEHVVLQSPFGSGIKEVHWKFAVETHKYVREFIANADTKAQHYIVFASAFLIWMNPKDSLKFWAIPAKEWRLIDFLQIVSILSMSVCILAALSALLPRLKGSKKGIVFFDSVSENEVANDYLGDVLKKNEQEIVIEELRHIYELSKICSGKFQSLKISVWSGAIGLIFGIAILLFR